MSTTNKYGLTNTNKIASFIVRMVLAEYMIIFLCINLWRVCLIARGSVALIAASLSWVTRTLIDNWD